MIHAVGMAATAERAPRLIELEWGDPKNPRLALVGKGVVFASGGLAIKPAAGMRLLTKDMGGAANARAIARLIWTTTHPLRPPLLIPALETAITVPPLTPGD